MVPPPLTAFPISAFQNGPRVALLRHCGHLQLKSPDRFVGMVQQVIEVPRPQHILQIERLAPAENYLPIPPRPPERVSRAALGGGPRPPSLATRFGPRARGLCCAPPSETYLPTPPRPPERVSRAALGGGLRPPSVETCLGREAGALCCGPAEWSR